MESITVKPLLSVSVQKYVRSKETAIITKIYCIESFPWKKDMKQIFGRMNYFSIFTLNIFNEIFTFRRLYSSMDVSHCISLENVRFWVKMYSNSKWFDKYLEYNWYLQIFWLVKTFDQNRTALISESISAYPLHSNQKIYSATGPNLLTELSKQRHDFSRYLRFGKLRYSFQDFSFINDRV